MAATLLHGPTGRPLLVAGAKGEPEYTSEAIAKTGLSPAELERRYSEEVAKRVHARQVSMGTVWDKQRGKQKPTPVTFETLRAMSRYNEWVAAVIKTRQNKIAGVKWSINPKDGGPQGPASGRMQKKIEGLFKRPAMHGSRPQNTSWRAFISMFIEDLLVLDAGTIEKERDGNGWIVAMYNVDGATIRPNLDNQGGWQDDAYVQQVDGITCARFGVEDLIYCMDNPQTDVKFFGYGYSPLEKLVVSVTADLHAAKYNADYFTKGAVPEGALDLGEDASPEDVNAFRLYWMHEIMGKPWNLPIFGGSKGADWKSWRDSNRDMQFMEYQDWLLQKICAVYQVSKKELGAIDDVNRSTAEDSTEQDDRKGIMPLLELCKDTFDLEVIGEHGQGLGDYFEFAWQEQGEAPEAINKKMQPLVDSGAATKQEWRDAHGMGEAKPGAVGAEGLHHHASTGTHTPLPSNEDAMTMGASAQQDREDEQADLDRQSQEEQAKHAGAAGDDGGPASSTPWQPASGDDPGVKRAMADHDKRSGIGARQVGKSHPSGHDRNPAVTQRQDTLDDVLQPALARLADGLAEIFGAPA